MGKTLSERELEYYSRQIVLPEFGKVGQNKLKRSRVCIAGLGGLGSPISIQLTSMGVGYLRLVDQDVVELSNLQRQHLYEIDKIGYPKVEVAAERLRGLNPFIDLEPLPMRITEKNVEKIIEGMDVVVDGLDRMSPRYALNRACQNLEIPYVFGAVMTRMGNISTIIPGKTACLECFQGNLDDSDLPTCAVAGVHPSIISLVASIQVSEAVRILLDKPPNLANKLLFCDLEKLSFDVIPLMRVQECPVCGSNPLGKPMKLASKKVEEICGRSGRRVFVFSSDVNLNVEMKSLINRLQELGYELDVASNYGTTFSGRKVRGSILKSGVTILEGSVNKEEAIRLHQLLLSEISSF
jgi:adenylyltransferase/sulfurtransferase